MGTGITATAAVDLPLFGEHLSYVGLGIWLLASLMLVVMLILKILQSIFKPHMIKRQFYDPVMAQFFGAPPMALLTVAGGTLLLGHYVLAQETGWGGA